jgi:hypothetical protein
MEGSKQQRMMGARAAEGGREQGDMRMHSGFL